MGREDSFGVFGLSLLGVFGERKRRWRKWISVGYWRCAVVQRRHFRTVQLQANTSRYTNNLIKEMHSECLVKNNCHV